MKVEVLIHTPGQAAAFKQFLDAYYADSAIATQREGPEERVTRSELAVREAPKPASDPTPLERAIGEQDADPAPEKSPFDLLQEEAPNEAAPTEAPKKRGRPKKEATIEAAVEKELTIDDVRAAGKIVMENIDIEAIQSTLAKFGAAQMKDLRPQDYALVLQHFRKLMNDAGKVWPK